MKKLPRVQVQQSDDEPVAPTIAPAAPLKLQEVGARRGIIRHNPRMAPVVPEGDAPDGYYRATQGVAIANKAYDPELAKKGVLQHETPCEHLNPHDVVRVPEALDAREAYPLTQSGVLVPATEADLRRGPARELPHAHVGLG